MAVVAGSVAGVDGSVGSVRDRVGTALGGEGGTGVWLRLIATAVAVLAIVVGVVGAWSVRDRQAALDDAVGRVEPLSVTTQEVFRSLSDADATAATIFLSGQAATNADASRYTVDTAQASSGALTVGVDPGASVSVHADVAVISVKLPVYMQLVATALADNRQGLPVGAAYLRDASTLMRSTILPAAEDAYRIESARLAADEAAATAVPVAEIAFGLLLVAVLVAAQVFLVRRTQRWINAGVGLATLAVLALVGWTVLDLTGEAGAIGRAQRDGQAVAALVDADLTAVRAHGDEVLSVAARGEDSGAYEKDFGASSAQLGRLLTDARGLTADVTAAAIGDAVTQNAAWTRDHAAQQPLETAPQADTSAYTQALALVTGTDPLGSGAAFSRLDADLGHALAQEQAVYRGAVGDGQGDLSGLAVGTAVLSALAAIAGLGGVYQRLREYR